MSEIKEECGVFGIIEQDVSDVASTVYYGLYALQHRGQESCGITVNNNGEFTTYADLGLVEKVFSPEKLYSLGEGNMAIGHVRYGTAKTKDRDYSQPMTANFINGKISIANNGSLTNYKALRKELEMSGTLFRTDSDAELIASIVTKQMLVWNGIEEAVIKTMDKLEGAYCFLIMIEDKIIAVRDKMGIRPMCYGQTADGAYIVATESCALEASGAHLVRDLLPGEILIFEQGGVKSIKANCGKEKCALCVFEYIYFARPDSVIDGASVHAARQQAGAFLAQEHPVNADVVIGVPDSGIDAAIGYSKQSGIPYGLGFIKNKYIGRTFILPGQGNRENMVRIKLNPITDTVKGKRVVLIDDSIVRGTTCAHIVNLIREAGATEVHMRISSPPFLYPCYYGTDVSSKDMLIACNHSVEEIRRIIGVDSLGYLNVSSVKKIATVHEGISYCTACFDGNYPTKIKE